MKSFFSASLVLAVIPLVCGHGIITDPKPRAAGPAMAKVCGQQVTGQQTSDNGGNIEGELQVASSQKDYDATQCNLFLCKGYQLGDNMANVQAYTPGQVIPLKVAIKAPHTGTANVSIVDTKAGAVIGTPLISFDDYASTKHTIPENNTAFSITMPQDLGGKCAAAGDCVIQWFWFSAEAKQTYESCIDFTAGGGAPAARIKPRQEIASESMTMGPKSTMTLSVMSGSATAKSTSTGFKLTGTAANPTSGSTSSPTAGVIQSNDSQSMNAGPLVKFSLAWSVALSLLALI